MVIALRFGQKLGCTPPSVAERSVAVLDAVGLPTRGPLLDRSRIWEVMSRDKKAQGDDVLLFVPREVGSPELAKPTRRDVDEVLDLPSEPAS